MLRGASRGVPLPSAGGGVSGGMVGGGKSSGKVDTLVIPDPGDFFRGRLVDAINDEVYLIRKPSRPPCALAIEIGGFTFMAIRGRVIMALV